MKILANLIIIFIIQLPIQIFAQEEEAKVREIEEKEAVKNLRNFQVVKRNSIEVQRKANEKTPQLIVEVGHSDLVSAIVFSPNGKFIASASHDNTIKLWDAATGKELRTFNGHNQPVESLVFSPDGSKIASAGIDDVVILWDIATGQNLHTFDEDLYINPVGFGPGNWVVLFSPDGKNLYFDSYGIISLWNIETGKELKISESSSTLVTSPAISPDWKLCASTYENSPNLIRIWSLEAEKEIKILAGHTGGVESIEFSPDNKTLISKGSTDDSLRLWNLETGKEIRKVFTDRQFLSAKFSRDGKTIFIFSNNEETNSSKIKALNAVTGIETTADISQTGILKSAEILPNGNMIILLNNVNEKTNIAKILDVETGREIKTIRQKQDGDFKEIIYSPQSDVFVFLYDYLEYLDATHNTSEKKFKLWNSKSNTIYTPKHDEGVISAVFSPDGKTVVSFSEDRVIKLWNAETGKEIKTLINYRPSSPSVTVLSDGKTLSIDEDNKLWNIYKDKAPRITNVVDYSVDDEQTNVFLSPDGKSFASFKSNNFPVILQDVENKRVLQTFMDGNESVDTVLFLRDQKKLFTVDSKSIGIWDVQTGKNILKIINSDGDPTASYDQIFLSSDEKRLAVTQANGKTIAVFDVETGKKIKDIQMNGDYTGKIIFSPDNSILAMAAAAVPGDTIFLTDVSAGKIKNTLETLKLITPNGVANCDSIAFSPDGKILATSSREHEGAKTPIGGGTFNRKIKLWDTGSGKLIRSYDFDDPNTAREVFAIVPDLYLKSVEEPVTPDGKFQIKYTANGKLSIHELKTGKLLADLIFTGEKDWVVVSPDGRFDTNKLENPEGLHWLMPDMPFDPVSLEVFMRDYFEPNLLRRLLKCTDEGNCAREFKPVRDLSSLNRSQPRIEIKEIKTTASPDTVEITIEAANVTSEFQKDTNKKARESGVFDLRLFRDGQMIGHSTTDGNLEKTFRIYENFDEELKIWRETNKVELKDNKKTFSFRVKLPNDAANRPIEFSAYAFNEDRVKSETSRRTFTIPKNTGLQPKPRKAFVVTFGVNKYDNPEWNLRFASNDARAMREIISEKLRARKEFAEVVEIPLISDDETSDGKTIEKRDAVKENIKTVLDLLSGKIVSAENLKMLEKALGASTLAKITPANPDDMVLMSFSSHGYADRNGVFYILPTDIGKNSGRQVSNELLGRSISSDELSLWLRDIDATEMVMIVDACHAASAVEGKDFKPAPMGSRGLGQLAFDKGMRILTATQAANAAIESGGSIGHGLLTYALLREGLDKNEADFKAKDKTINLKEWLEYGEIEVPKLYEKLAKGELKGVGRGAERIDLTGTDKKQIPLQTPTLFDFTRKRREIILVKLP